MQSTFDDSTHPGSPIWLAALAWTKSLPAGLLLAASLLLAPALSAQEADTAAQEAATSAQEQMAEMMARAARYTQPGEHHEALQRFLGTWDTTMRITMAGMGDQAEKGVVTFSWLIEGRWLVSHATGTMMGMPMEAYMTLGYDNFKQSYVTAQVSSVDTALLTSEGDMDPSGKALITYGTLDEYLTGENDKMVKYVWRFLSPNEMVLEVHDLPIGEKDSQVIELRYKKRQEGEG